MMMKPFPLMTALALTLTTALAPTAAWAQSAPSSAYVTQAQAVTALLHAFSQVPTWPKGLIVPTNHPTRGDWVDNKPGLPPSHWTGLACVFPGQPTSAYPQLLGMVPSTPDAPVTAGQVADWIVQWEIRARRVNLRWEPTRDPFALLKLFSFFYGTNLPNPNSKLTAADLAAIDRNILEVSRGWRMLAANKVQTLEPLMIAPRSQFGLVIGSAPRWEQNKPLMHKLGYGNLPYKVFTWADWPAVYAHVVALQDSMTLTFLQNGNVVYNRAPGHGYALWLAGVFVGKNGDALGNWYWGQYQYADTFDRPLPAVFKAVPHDGGFAPPYYIPKTQDHVFYFSDFPISVYSWPFGGHVAAQFQLVFGYHDGKIRWVENGVKNPVYPIVGNA